MPRAPTPRADRLRRLSVALAIAVAGEMAVLAFLIAAQLFWLTPLSPAFMRMTMWGWIYLTLLTILALITGRVVWYMTEFRAEKTRPRSIESTERDERFRALLFRRGIPALIVGLVGGSTFHMLSFRPSWNRWTTGGLIDDVMFGLVVAGYCHLVTMLLSLLADRLRRRSTQDEGGDAQP